MDYNIKREVGLFLKKSVEGNTDMTIPLKTTPDSAASMWVANDGTTTLSISFNVDKELQTISIKSTEQMEIPFRTEEWTTSVAVIANSNPFRFQLYM